MYTEILILGQLLTGPKHGYEIKKRIQEALGEAFEINHNSLYPTLRRLLDNKAISKVTQKTEGRPDRHVYQLAETGQSLLVKKICHFPPKIAANQTEFLVRVALFDAVEREDRFDILNKRLAVLMEEKAHYDMLRHNYSPLAHVKEILRFKEEQLDHEIAWINQQLHE